MSDTQNLAMDLAVSRFAMDAIDFTYLEALEVCELSSEVLDIKSQVERTVYLR